MDDTGRKPGHLMLITPERVFYAGLLGRPRQRCSGAFNIYVAIEGGLLLTTADGAQVPGEMIAVLPNTKHTIASDFRTVLSIVIEPESVRSGTLEEFAERLTGPEAAIFASRIRAAYSELREHHPGSDFSSAEFDTLCLGEILPPRDSIRAWQRRSCRSENSPASRSPPQAAPAKRTCRRRASCISSRKRPAFPSVRSAPGSGRGICCTSPTRTSTSRIWRRISAIPTRPISATRSAASMD